MDPRLNPFVVKPGVRPFQLFGRGVLTEDFDVTLHRLAAGRPATAPFITGPRGIGKTVLFNEFVAMARKRQWYVSVEEVDRKVSFPSLIAVMAHDILLAMSAEQRIRDRVRRVLGLLKAFTSVSALGIKLEINVDKVRGADTGLFDRDLRLLLIEIGRLAEEQGRGVLFALDEIHVLSEPDLDSVHAAMHALGQQQLPVALLGAGLFPSWRSGLKDTWDPTRVSTYPARLFTSTYLRLEPLSEYVSEEALIATARSEGGDLAMEASKALAQYCEGNPWVLQLVGSLAWNISAGPVITRNDARQAMAQAERDLASYFFPRLLRTLSDRELQLLLTLARVESYPVCLGDFVAACGARSWHAARALMKEVTSLKEKDLVFTQGTDVSIGFNDGEVLFTVPRLREYLRASLPGRFEREAD